MMTWQQEIEHIHATTIKKSGIITWSRDDSYFLALALCGEVGELANRIKKHWRNDDGLPPMTNDPMIRHELADVRVYLHLLSTLLAVDLDEAVTEKLPQIRDKFCQLGPKPSGWDKEHR